jgi:murein L,D-transpeptidase YafK
VAGVHVRTFFVFSVIVVFFFLASIVYGEDEKSESPEIPVNIISAHEGDAVIIVGKESQKLELWQMKDSVYSKILSKKCSTGKVKGVKKKSGDSKTPEGVYYITGHFPDKYLSPVYGTHALPLDYPNNIDMLEDKTGSAIWIHGTNKVLKNRDTNGCIALVNSDIDELVRYVSVERTAVVISDKIEYGVPDGELRETIITTINSWANALSGDSYHKYLDHYSQQYLPAIGWWGQWREKIDTFESEFGATGITVENISVVKAKGYIAVLLDLYLNQEDLRIFVGSRKMYFTNTGDGYKISGDDFKQITEIPETASDKKDSGMILISSVDILASLAERKKEDMLALNLTRQQNEIKGFVANWVKAWTEGDFDFYSQCYSKAFSEDGMDRDAWIKKKKYLDSIYKYIDVRVDNIRVDFTGAQAVAVFGQKYRSSGYFASGTKKLVLIQEDETWKIFREIWKKS